jgi:glycosyltransferase involved in cell wall biosynthesis
MTLRRQFDRARRRIEERIDQAWTKLAHVQAPKFGPPFDGEPRFALITANYSTTRYLKLMLLTLAEQSALQLLKRIILVDNCSRDGGLSFLRELAERTHRISIVENRWFLNHARGMRRGLRLLDMIEADAAATDSANIVLSCDADVVFRRRDTLSELARFSSKRAPPLLASSENICIPTLKPRPHSSR